MADIVEDKDVEQEEGLTLIEGIVPHDGKEPFADLRSTILSLKETMDNSRWQMAEIFFQINSEGIYQRWGYNSFEQYVEMDVSMSSRTAQYLVAMFNWFANEVGPQLSDEDRDEMLLGIRGLGWAKAKCLVGVAGEEDVLEWIARAKEMTSSELQAETKRALVEKDGGDPGEVKTTKSMTTSFDEDQYVIIEAALSKAQDISGEKKKGNLWALIAQDFVSTNTTKPDEQDKNRERYFQKIGSIYNVNLIAVDPETKKVIHGKKYVKAISK